jgi:hypothetical protein
MNAAAAAAADDDDSNNNNNVSGTYAVNLKNSVTYKSF